MRLGILALLLSFFVAPAYASVQVITDPDATPRELFGASRMHAAGDSLAGPSRVLAATQSCTLFAEFPGLPRLDSRPALPKPSSSAASVTPGCSWEATLPGCCRAVSTWPAASRRPAATRKQFVRSHSTAACSQFGRLVASLDRKCPGPRAYQGKAGCRSRGTGG